MLNVPDFLSQRLFQSLFCGLLSVALSGCSLSGMIPSSTTSNSSSTPSTYSQDSFQQPLSGNGGNSSLGSASSSGTLSLASTLPIVPAQGGTNTQILLSGYNFLPGLTITVGGTPCNSISISNIYTATCFTPVIGATGAQIVLLTDPTTGDTATTTYTYNAAPTLTSVSPTLGGSNTSLTLTGTGLLAGATVTVGGTHCPITASALPTSLTCTIPAHSPGTVAVQITNGDGQTVSLSQAFTYEVVGNQIVTGLNHTCTLVNGGVQCWGDNTYGQLGNNSTVASNILVPVSGLTSGVQSIAAGDNHTCAIVNGGAHCWGLNNYGQLGNTTNAGTNAANKTPLPVTALTSGVISITAGIGHTCASVSTTGIQCWGWNHYGQLGNTTNSGTDTANTTPTTVVNTNPSLLLNGDFAAGQVSNTTWAQFTGPTLLPGGNGDFETGVTEWTSFVGPSFTLASGQSLHGDFEIAGDLGASTWQASSGSFQGSTPAISAVQAHSNTHSMMWQYANSSTLPLQTTFIFSTPQDFSNYNTISVWFFHDTWNDSTQTRTISITLNSVGASASYSLSTAPGGANLPNNSWTQLISNLNKPNSTTGTGFNLESITSISLTMQDSTNQSGTVFWDQLEISSGKNTTTPETVTQSTTQVKTGTHSMKWAYTNSATFPPQATEVFSTPQDYSNYNYMVVYFYNDINNGAITRTLSMALKSGSSDASPDLAT